MKFVIFGLSISLNCLSLSLAQSLLKGRNAPIRRIGNRRVNICSCWRNHLIRWINHWVIGRATQKCDKKVLFEKLSRNFTWWPGGVCRSIRVNVPRWAYLQNCAGLCQRDKKIIFESEISELALENFCLVEKHILNNLTNRSLFAGIFYPRKKFQSI